MAAKRPPANRTPNTLRVWGTAAVGMAAALTMGATTSTTAIPDECVGVEAWVSVLGGAAMGVTEKYCVHPTGCNTLTSTRPELGPPDVVHVVVGVWVPNPVAPDPLCLV